MEKSIEVVLLNRWTHLIQGHGQDEVERVKNFVFEEYGLKSRIFCITSEFGDIHKAPPLNPLDLIPNLFRRGWVFRVSLKKFRNDIYRTWANVLNKETEIDLRVVLTSGDFRDVLELTRISNGKFKVYARVTHYNPEVLSSQEKLLLSSAADNGLLRLGIETQSARRNFSDLGFVLKSYWVPPAQGMHDFQADYQVEDLKIGLIYALNHKPSVESVRNLLEKLSCYNLIVRLPNHKSYYFLKSLYPKVKFIENGLALNDFEESLSKVNFAILPHQGYKLKGSGLAYYFLAKGVPILIDKNNSFFDEISQSNLVISCNDVPNLTQSFLNKALANRFTVSPIEESANIRKRVKLQWSEFLNGID